MKQDYDIDYCTFNLIPKYRQNYITLRLYWLIELLQFHNNHWPIDYMELLEKIKTHKPFHFEYAFIDLSDKHDALTVYVEEHSLHIIFVNRNKVTYHHDHPAHKKSSYVIDRELAHIVLGHLLIPRISMTPEELNIDEHDADEFAATFLNAGAVGFSNNYCHPKSSILKI